MIKLRKDTVIIHVEPSKLPGGTVVVMEPIDGQEIPGFEWLIAHQIEKGLADLHYYPSLGIAVAEILEADGWEILEADPEPAWADHDEHIVY